MFIYKLVGIIYALTIVSETAAILLVMISLFRLRLWRSLPFYYLASANLINDLIMTLVHGLYMTPAIIAESYLFPDETENVVIRGISFVFVITWYTGASLDIIIAFDRLFMIKKRRAAFSTEKSAVIAAILPFVISTLVTAAYSMFSPCCRFLLMWQYFGYAFYNPKNEFNWTDSTADLPLNILTSIISLVCYVWIGVHIIKEKKRIGSTQGQSTIRKRDYALAINYGIISLLFTSVWGTLRIFAWVYEFKYLWMMAVTPFLSMLKCSANAVTFLKNNREIRRDIRKILRFRKGPNGARTTITSLGHRASSNDPGTSNR